jgi:hypothetical protein
MCRGEQASFHRTRKISSAVSLEFQRPRDQASYIFVAINMKGDNVVDVTGSGTRRDDCRRDNFVAVVSAVRHQCRIAWRPVLVKGPGDQARSAKYLKQQGGQKAHEDFRPA